MATTIVCFLYFTKARIYQFHSNYANDINAWFLEENEQYIDSLNLPELQLEISDENRAHIKELQGYIDAFDFNAFQFRNLWRPAKITISDLEYPVEFRVHGKTPNGQSVGEHVSLAIRSDQPILGQKRFNLIIYERISVNADRIAALGDAFELYHQEDELIRVQINETQPKLYYLETPIKKPFLGEYGLVNFELENQKSPIINQCSDAHVLDVDLLNKLLKIKISTSMHIEIHEAYTDLNLAIIQNDVQKIRNYFDLDYIARFQVARFVAGFQNHGFSPENLLFAIDTTSFLFYPILHRDNYFGELDTNNLNSWTPYYYKNVEQFDYAVLRLITANRTILAQTEKYFNKNQTKINELALELDAIDKKHNAILQANGLFTIEVFQPHHLRSNQEILKKWFKR
jgi:hypothetical protein